MGYRFKVQKDEVFNKIYNLSQFNPGQLRLFNNMFMLMRGTVINTNNLFILCSDFSLSLLGSHYHPTTHPDEIMEYDPDIVEYDLIRPGEELKNTKWVSTNDEDLVKYISDLVCFIGFSYPRNHNRYDCGNLIDKPHYYLSQDFHFQFSTVDSVTDINFYDNDNNTEINITDYFIKVDGVFKLKPFTLKKPTFVI